MGLLDELGARPAWQRDALCREHPRVNFHPERGESVEPAKRICARCLVTVECLEDALAAGETAVGVWGGLSGRERSQIIRRRRQAATASAGASPATLSPLRARRTELGLTQRDVAERLGVTQEAVSAWERGTTTPRAELAAALAEILTD